MQDGHHREYGGDQLHRKAQSWPHVLRKRIFDKQRGTAYGNKRGDAGHVPLEPHVVGPQIEFADAKEMNGEKQAAHYLQRIFQIEGFAQTGPLQQAI